jgi:hypothetical protein
MKRTITVTAATLLLAFAGTGAASAHSLAVHPPGHDQAVFSDSISRGWAHAHCEAAAPAVATDATAVITFTPSTALEGCPVLPPPGHQS